MFLKNVKSKGDAIPVQANSATGTGVLLVERFRKSKKGAVAVSVYHFVPLPKVSLLSVSQQQNYCQYQESGCS